jgi:hypothetical protein
MARLTAARAVSGLLALGSWRISRILGEAHNLLGLSALAARRRRFPGALAPS